MKYEAFTALASRRIDVRAGLLIPGLILAYFLAGGSARLLGADAGSTIEFQTVGSGVSEVGATNAVLTVVRLGSLAGTASVDYATSNGTAVAGLDFVGQAGTLVFNPGEQVKTITIFSLDDALAEGEESFTVVLSHPLGATLGYNPIAYVSVND